MVFLFDTNAVSDLMEAHARLQARLKALAPVDRAIVCSIVRGEILYGIERLAPGRRRDALDANAAAVFAELPCEPVPEPAGDRYASLKIECKRLGVALNENDFWIAATALALGATLVTRDKDFDHVPGLSVEDWTA